MEKYDSGICTICTDYFTLLHWHHTTPQAYGGEDSLEIPLCSDCHNVLHAQADAVVAKIRNGTPIKRTYWKNSAIADRAQQYVALIVNAILYYSQEDGNKEYKLNVKVNSDVHKGLRLLKQDLEGVTNLPDTVLFCIVEVLSSRGIYNVTTTNDKKQRQSKNTPITKRSKTDLW